MASAQVNRQFVLTKGEYFSEIQLWPLRKELDCENWLKNFTNSELPHAVQLLNSFLYFSNPLLDAMFVAAFQTLSMKIADPRMSIALAREKWREFVDSVIVTYPTGETPNPTDSGFTYARKARQLLQIPQERIVSPQDALATILSGAKCPIVFVDDFVGTGHQFATTWQREVPSLGKVSFKTSGVAPGSCFYCPLFCTEKGNTTLAGFCPEVILSPVHLLSSRFSALAGDSLIWPPKYQTTAFDFLQQASKRAGIPDSGGSQPDDWQGFGKLGLTLALGDSVPDATLPIFYWEKNGWKPLVRRR